MALESQAFIPYCQTRYQGMVTRSGTGQTKSPWVRVRHPQALGQEALWRSTTVALATVHQRQQEPGNRTLRSGVLMDLVRALPCQSLGHGMPGSSYLAAVALVEPVQASGATVAWRPQMPRSAAVSRRNQTSQPVLGQDGLVLAHMIIMGATGWVTILCITCTSQTRVRVSMAAKRPLASGPSQAMSGTCLQVGIVLVGSRPTISRRSGTTMRTILIKR